MLGVRRPFLAEWSLGCCFLGFKFGDRFRYRVFDWELPCGVEGYLVFLLSSLDKRYRSLAVVQSLLLCMLMLRMLLLLLVVVVYLWSIYSSGISILSTINSSLAQCRTTDN